MDMKIYHTKFSDRSVLTCIDLIDPDLHVYARGLSICSPKDNWNRKRGILIAKGRCLTAYTTKKNISPILIKRPLHKCHMAMTAAQNLSEYKGTYFPKNKSPK